MGSKVQRIQFFSRGERVKKVTVYLSLITFPGLHSPGGPDVGLRVTRRRVSFNPHYHRPSTFPNPLLCLKRVNQIYFSEITFLVNLHSLSQYLLLVHTNSWTSVVAVLQYNDRNSGALVFHSLQMTSDHSTLDTFSSRSPSTYTSTVSVVVLFHDPAPS